MIPLPHWQEPLYKASIGVATLLDEIDAELGDCDESHSVLWKHTELLQRHITKLETILYKEKANAIQHIH